MADEITFKVENAEVVFRNFAGAEKPFNKAGDRNFCVILDPAVADQLAADGWNIKVLAAKEEGDVDRPYIQVTVKYSIKPPRIVVLTEGGNRTEVDEGMVDMLDWADIKTWDIIVRAYEWDMNGKTGVKAYLKTMFAVINEDDLERKYNVNGLG